MSESGSWWITLGRRHPAQYARSQSLNKENFMDSDMGLWTCISIPETLAWRQYPACAGITYLSLQPRWILARHQFGRKCSAKSFLLKMLTSSFSRHRNVRILYCNVPSLNVLTRDKLFTYVHMLVSNQIRTSSFCWNCSTWDWTELLYVNF